MRLLKLGVNHPAYHKQFYDARPNLATQSYTLQHAALIEDCYGSSDFWTSALGQFGYEMRDVIANAAPLQKRWAREHGESYEESRWLFDISAAQIKKFRPDVLLVADFSIFNAAFLRQIKRECPSIRLVIGWCGAPYNDATVFREWDIALSCIPELVAHFRDEGHRSFHLNHAFAPRILEKIDTSSATVPVNFSFLGSILKHDRFHIEREKILLRLIAETDLQIWSDVAGRATSRRERRGVRARQLAFDAVRVARASGIPASILRRAPLVRRVARWETRPGASATHVDERIARRAHPPLFGLAMFRQLRDSRVALNTHIDISPHSASNMRLFEATGVGSCLLTDWKSNLSELFVPDVEVLTYRSPAECVEKARYILAHEDERRAIAAAGQRRTLRAHTFTQRAERIDEIIRAALSNV